MILKYILKKLLIRILTLFILIITSLSAFAQFFDAEQNPPSVKFRQINTPQFQIIYPTLFEAEAQRMANVLNAIVDEVSKSLGRKPEPISIILQNQGVVANGFVQMAPRRSEFYTIPPQEFDAQDWLNSLAVHELRHVVQFDKLAPAFKAPLFEELKLALFGINLPSWYFEGDAVGIETILTHAGRGRQPSFELTLRTNELSGNHFSYSKNYLGSFKDYTPDYYSVGYFMTTKMRRDFGSNIFDKILSRIQKFPIRPYGFSSSLKNFGGVGTRRFYFKTMNELDSLWSDQLEKTKFETYPVLQKTIGKIPSAYLLPYATKSGEIICLKVSKAEPSKIIIIDKSKQEKTLIKIAAQNEANLSVSERKIVWDEYRTDKRYGKRSFNVICSYDMVTKKHKQLTQKSRLFSPAISADGKKIIAVKVSTESIFNLVELDAETGNEIRTFENPKNFTLQTPNYNQSGDQIIVTAVNERGKTLLLYRDGKIEQLLPQETQIISRPSFFKNQIIYKAHYNGIDNIYAFDLISKKISQLSNVKFGAYNPSVDERNETLYFNNYQAKGNDISSIDLKSAEAFKPVTQVNTFVKYFEPLIAQENNPNIFKNIPNQVYPSSTYSDFKNLFYFHSARVYNETNTFTDDFNYGIDFVSNNKLNILSSSFGYRYNNALNKSEYLASFVYQKYYPQISVNYENRARLAYAQQIINTETILIPINWRENNTSLKVNIPFAANWFNKNFYTNLSTETSYTSRYQIVNRVANFKESISFPLKYQINAGINTRTASRDLAPKWGQNFSLVYAHFPFEKAINGDRLYLKTAFYFPGLMVNHSFQVSLNWQKNSGIYFFDYDIPRASGFANLAAIPNLHNSVLLDYKFPIAYPDWEIGPLAYIKRLKGGFFTDFENINEGGGLRTYGAELRADMNLLRYYLPNFDLGGKIIIPAEGNSKKPIFELGFTINY